MRVNQGISNSCVIGEIDVEAMCQFQISYHSQAKPFKPVLHGFEVDFGRKVLAAGDLE